LSKLFFLKLGREGETFCGKGKTGLNWCKTGCPVKTGTSIYNKYKLYGSNQGFEVFI